MPSRRVFDVVVAALGPYAGREEVAFLLEAFLGTSR